MPLVGDRALDRIALANRVVAAARSHAGLGYGGAQTRRDAFVSWLFPHDPAAQARPMARSMSSCGLHALSCWRAAGVDAPELRGSYVPGMAIAWVVQIAKRAGAWVDCTGSLDGIPDPDEGCVVLIGSTADPAYGGTEHVFPIVSVDDGLVTSADGGQVDTLGPCIRERRRVFVRRGGGLWALSADDGHSPQVPGPGRRVAGYCRSGELPQLDPVVSVG